MKKHLRGLLATFIVLALMGGTYGIYRYFNRNVTIKIAVETMDSDEAQQLIAFSQWLTLEKRRYRLLLVPFDKANPQDLLKSRKAQMAVIRADEVIARQYSSVAVLHKEAAVLATLSGSNLSKWSGLKGKTLGIVGRIEPNDVFLKTLLKMNGLENQKTVKITQAQISEQLQSKQIAAFIFIAPIHNSFSEIVQKNHPMRGMNDRRKIISIEDAETKASQDKRYQEAEIAAGSLRANPALPAEAITTLSVNRHLITSEGIPNRLVSLFLRDLFDAKRALLRDNPLFNLVQPPDLETDAHVKVHAGAALYYNNEETSIGEYLSEQVYLVPMILGALGSFIVWLMHFLNPKKQHENASVMMNLLSFKRNLKGLKTDEEIQAMKASFDAMYVHFKLRIDQNEVQDDVAIPLLEAFDEVETLLEKRVAKLAKA